MIHIKSTVVLLSFLMFSSETIAGTVDIAVDPGKRAAIGAVYKDGSEFLLMANENNGGVRVVIPDEANVVRSIVVTQYLGRVFSFSLSSLGIGGLVSLEPFSLPEFASVDENVFLVAQFDTDSFLSSGITFNFDEVTTATDGVVSDTPHIEFFDGSTLPENIESATISLLDSSFISSLPRYSGGIKVVATAQFSIPTPSTLLLLLGVAPLILYQRHYRIKRKGRRLPRYCKI
jgi:hypothetical protein